MKSILSLFVAAVVTLGLMGISAEAEAKRFGGGKSFGGSSSFSSPYKRTTPSQGAATSPSKSAAAPQTPQRSGLMGMLGGLALGGLLGALFFGGAFENINLFDIMVFALIGFVLYRLFAARRQKPAPAMPGVAREMEPQSQADFNTDVMFGGGAPQATAAPMPADFDQVAFLEGAQNAYRRLQTAWDAGDLADIRQFTTDKVFAEAQEQLRARAGENRTDVLKLEVELLEARELDGELQATVLFDAILREESEAQPAQVREVWHFLKPKGAAAPTWFLDGIQQLAE